MQSVMIEKKPNIIQRIMGSIWRHNYAKRMNESRPTRVECYREMMAERDSRPLIVPNR